MNPCAGTKKANKYLTDILILFGKSGYNNTVYLAESRGDGKNFAKKNANRFDLIVAIGGDGTFNEVVSGVLQSGKDVEIGYIPAGSINDFANSLKLSQIIEIRNNKLKVRTAMYKFLLWDIDGTVLNFLASEAYAIRFLFKKYNIGECSDEMLKMYSGINSKYWQKLEKGELTKPEILIGRFKEFFSIIGVDTAIAEDFNREYQVTLGDHIEFVDKAKDVLLCQKGKYVLAAVTNGTKVAQEKKLRLSGLNKVFDEIFISENVGFEKPNGEYFEYVFEKLGVTDKSEVLIIGDSLTSDIKGGFDSGIDTCWFNPAHKQNTLNIPITYEIDDIGKIEDIVV